MYCGFTTKVVYIHNIYIQVYHHAHLAGIHPGICTLEVKSSHSVSICALTMPGVSSANGFLM